MFIILLESQLLGHNINNQSYLKIKPYDKRTNIINKNLYI